MIMPAADSEQSLPYSSNEEWRYAQAYFARNPAAVKLSRQREGKGHVSRSFWKMDGVIYTLIDDHHAPLYRKPYAEGSSLWTNSVKQLIDERGNKKILKIQTLLWRNFDINTPTISPYQVQKCVDDVKYSAYFQVEREIAYDLQLTPIEPTEARYYVIPAQGLGSKNLSFNKSIIKSHQYPYAVKTYMLYKQYHQDLLDRLEKNEAMSFTERFCLAIDIACELHKLHSGKLSSKKKNYAHFDLHTKNIMFDHAGKIKFIDFENTSEFCAATLNSLKWSDKRCVPAYKSSSTYDNYNAIYQDIFALLRVFYMPKIMNYTSVFTADSLSRPSQQRENQYSLDELLDTSSGRLSSYQKTSALSLAGRMMTACYSKLKHYQPDASEHEQKQIKTSREKLINTLLLEALEIAANNTSDPVKRLFVDKMVTDLDVSKKNSFNDLKDKLYVIMRNLSHHQSFLKGRWTTQHGITSQPLAYSSCQDYLLQAAELLECSRVAKNVLYKDKAKLDKNIQTNSYAFFASQYQSENSKSATVQPGYIAA
jgi:hypothetical protein